jgi:hypothetical protein
LREKFISAYGELHVGHDLLRAGCTIRYDDEYEVDGGLLKSGLDNSIWRTWTPGWTPKTKMKVIIYLPDTPPIAGHGRTLPDGGLPQSRFAAS